MHRKVFSRCFKNTFFRASLGLATGFEKNTFYKGQKIKLVSNDQECIEKFFPGVLKTPFFGPRCASLRVSFRSEMRKNCSEHGSSSYQQGPIAFLCLS